MAERKPGKGIHKVIGGVAVVRTLDGSERYLYKHATFDAAGADAESVKHLLGVGLIAVVKAPPASSTAAKAKADAEAKAKADAAAKAAADAGEQK